MTSEAALKFKICMVGTFGVGKTSLVTRFVKSSYSEKYLTTLGVKVDKKEVTTQGRPITLMLWDLAGKDALTDIKPANLGGSSGYILVADGSRRSTLDAAIELQDHVEKQLGKLPFTLVVNKADLRDTWEVDETDLDRIRTLGWTFLLTSAKSGEAVEALFLGLAERMVHSTVQDKDSHA
jgi:small GTP-binding protein